MRGDPCQLLVKAMHCLHTECRDKMEEAFEKVLPRALCEQCRPDNRAWRPFLALSGGQQALATLALSFALQAAYPSPLYIFDEIDCMLDSATAARVAEYIRSQGRSQYIVVSHKPQVHCLLSTCTHTWQCGHETRMGTSGVCMAIDERSVCTRVLDSKIRASGLQSLQPACE